MKQLLLLLLLTGPAARAQTLAPDSVAARPLPAASRPAAWQGGLLMGHDLFRVTNPRPSFAVGQYRVVPRASTPSPGFRIGFWVRRNFGPARRWLLQPEVAYSRNQSWHRVTNHAAPAPISPANPPARPADFRDLATAQDWQRLNLVLPVGLRLRPRLLVLGGLAAAYRIPTAYERSGQDFAIVESINHSMRRLGLAGQAGVGYEYGRLLLTARYERSLLNVARDISFDGQRYPFKHLATQVSFGMALRVAPVR